MTIDDKPLVLGGWGGLCNNGRQFHEQNRIYDAELIATAIPAASAFHPHYLIEGKERMNKRLAKLVASKDVGDGDFLDCYNQSINKDGLTGSITTKINTDNHHFVGERNHMERIRIRKLTPCECLRLMGFSKEDFDNLKDAGQSDSAIYHEAGDSIVVNCLIGLIGSLTDLDHEEISKEWAKHCSRGNGYDE